MKGTSRQAKNVRRRRAAGLCARCPGTHAEGRSLCNACRERQQIERRRERQKMTSPERPTTRACLRCDHMFASSGPGNRLCTPCNDFLGISPTPETVRRVTGVAGWKGGAS
jgi:hypothetical protein